MKYEVRMQPLLVALCLIIVALAIKDLWPIHDYQSTSYSISGEEILVPEDHLLLGQPININSAGVEELTVLDGVGPSMAKRIVNYREANGRFESEFDLKRVHGVGDKIFEKIRAYISVR